MSKNQTGRRLLLSGSTGLVSMGIQMLIGLILLPMLVLYLGDRLYGLWVLIATLLGYMGLLDLGFSRAVLRFVSQSLGEAREEASRWITVGLFSLLSLAAVGVVVSLVLWYFYPSIPGVAGFPPDYRAAVLIATLTFAIALPARCFQGLLSAHLRYDVINGILLAVAVLRAALIIAAIKTDQTFLFLVSILAVMIAIESIAMVSMGRIIHGPFRIRWSHIRGADVRQFFDYSIFSFFAEVADILRFRTYPLIIGPLLGVAAITPFAIAHRLVLLIGQAANTALANFTPVFSGIQGGRREIQQEKLLSAYLRFYKISCFFGVFVTGITFLLAPYFIQRWVGSDYGESSMLLRLMLLGSVCAIIQIPTVCLLFGISQHRFYAISNGIEAVLTIGLCIALSPIYGLVGAAIGGSAAMALIKTLVQPYWVSRLLGITLATLHLRYTLWNVLRPAFFILIVSLVLRGVSLNGYISIAATFLIVSLTYLVFIALVGFTREERLQIFNAIPYASRLRRNSA